MKAPAIVQILVAELAQTAQRLGESRRDALIADNNRFRAGDERDRAREQLAAAEKESAEAKEALSRLQGEMARICAEAGEEYDPATPVGRHAAAMVPGFIHALRLDRDRAVAAADVAAANLGSTARELLDVRASLRAEVDAAKARAEAAEAKVAALHREREAELEAVHKALDAVAVPRSGEVVDDGERSVDLDGKLSVVARIARLQRLAPTAFFMPRTLPIAWAIGAGGRTLSSHARNAEHLREQLSTAFYELTALPLIEVDKQQLAAAIAGEEAAKKDRDAAIARARVAEKERDDALLQVAAEAAERHRIEKSRTRCEVELDCAKAQAAELQKQLTQVIAQRDEERTTGLKTREEMDRQRTRAEVAEAQVNSLRAKLAEVGVTHVRKAQGGTS